MVCSDQELLPSVPGLVTSRHGPCFLPHAVEAMAATKASTEQAAPSHRLLQATSPTRCHLPDLLMPAAPL